VSRLLNFEFLILNFEFCPLTNLTPHFLLP
jgi:hypothetical protein